MTKREQVREQIKRRKLGKNQSPLKCPECGGLDGYHVQRNCKGTPVVNKEAVPKETEQI